MNNTNKSLINRFFNTVLIIAFIVTLIGFAIDIKNTVEYGGVDLRNRVVGARLWSRGLDPYHFKWAPDQGEELLDPLVDPQATTTRVSVPPTALLVHAPFGAVPYLYQRIGWLLAQWGAFIGSLMLLITSEPNSFRRKILLIVGLLFFSTHIAWRLHVERGQIYILYVFLLSLAYRVLFDSKSAGKQLNNTVLGGILIGLASAIRFPIIIMVIPMVLHQKFKLLAATLLSFLVFLLGSIAITGQTVWIQYLSALNVFESINSQSSSETEAVKFALPQTIEGMSNLSKIAPLETWNSSAQRILNVLFGTLPKTNVLIALLSAALLIYVLLIHVFKRHASYKAQLPMIDEMFLIGTLMVLIADIFLPAPRYVYNEVQILIPLILIFKHFTVVNHRVMTVSFLLILSLLIGSGALDWLPYQGLIGEYMMFGLMIGASLFLIAGEFSKPDVVPSEKLEL